MKSITFALILLIVSFSLSAVAQPGIAVFYQSPVKQIQLLPLVPSGGGVAKVGKMFVPGLTPQIVRTFDGAEAPVLISETKPIFIFQQPKELSTYPGHTVRDIKIVRLKARKNHRELQITTGASMFTFKAGTDENQMIPVDVTEVEGGFRIVPRADLPDGEYMVVLGNNPTGYDFGVRYKKS
jgi:hypothetical protein